MKIKQKTCEICSSTGKVFYSGQEQDEKASYMMGTILGINYFPVMKDVLYTKKCPRCNC